MTILRTKRFAKGEGFRPVNGDLVSPLGERIVGGSPVDTYQSAQRRDAAVRRMETTGEGPYSSPLFDAVSATYTDPNPVRQKANNMVAEGKAERINERKKEEGKYVTPRDDIPVPGALPKGRTHVQMYQDRMDEEYRNALIQDLLEKGYDRDYIESQIDRIIAENRSPDEFPPRRGADIDAAMAARSQRGS